MYKELAEKDPQLYQTNGVLDMLERNRQLKDAPERWHQETEEMFDVVITCEERCFDSVCEGIHIIIIIIDLLRNISCLNLDFLARGQKKNKIVHVINCNIRDNFQDASVGGKWILDMASLVRFLIMPSFFIDVTVDQRLNSQRILMKILKRFWSNLQS